MDIFQYVICMFIIFLIFYVIYIATTYEDNHVSVRFFQIFTGCNGILLFILLLYNFWANNTTEKATSERYAIDVLIQNFYSIESSIYAALPNSYDLFAQVNTFNGEVVPKKINPSNSEDELVFNTNISTKLFQNIENFVLLIDNSTIDDLGTIVWLVSYLNSEIIKDRWKQDKVFFNDRTVCFIDTLIETGDITRGKVLTREEWRLLIKKMFY